MKLNRVSYQIPKGEKGSHGRASITNDVVNECATCYPSALKTDYYWKTREIWKSLFKVLFIPQLKDNMLPEIKQDWVIVGIKKSVENRRWVMDMGLFLINKNIEFWLTVII